MRRYELIYILRPSLGEEQINTITEYTTQNILDENGTIIDLNKWGMKKLAYNIKKESQGYYIYCEFAGSPAAVAEIERRFRIDDGVLKYLTIKTADFMTEEAIQQAIGESEAKKALAAQADEEENQDADKADNDSDDADDSSTDDN